MANNKTAYKYHWKLISDIQLYTANLSIKHSLGTNLHLKQKHHRHGKVLIEKTVEANEMISISELTKGIFFVQILKGNERVRYKMVKY